MAFFIKKKETFKSISILMNFWLLHESFFLEKEKWKNRFAEVY